MWPAPVAQSPYFRWTVRPVSESCRTSLWSRRFTAWRSTGGPTACTRRRSKKRASPDLEITDPGLFFKGVLKEGVLQEKEGVSVAIEAGPLLPSTLPHEHGVGFEAIGIVSGKVAPATVHVNGGSGLDRDDRHAFAIWGVIGELPVHPKLRLVGEVNGESTQDQRLNNSALLGVIWQPTSKNVFLDAGIRRGISRAAPDWQFTIGLTFGFFLPTFSRQ